MKRDENMEEAYMRTKDELLVNPIVQAYADEMIFVSDIGRG
jgi:hypothetical protein